jgi:hypothetical protein
MPRDTEINPTKPVREQLYRLEPEYCANCGRDLGRKDVKELKPMEPRKIRWQTFCGYCGAFYIVEAEA